MDIYLKKYLKYKYKYINLLYQEGGGLGRAINIRDQINIYKYDDTSKDHYIFNFELDEYYYDPISLEKIHKNRAVLINNTIYDFVNLLKSILSEYIKFYFPGNRPVESNKIYYPVDPSNNKLITVSDLELIYKKARYQSNNIIIINIDFINKHYNTIIFNSIKQYRIEIKETIDQIEKN